MEREREREEEDTLRNLRLRWRRVVAVLLALDLVSRASRAGEA